MTDRSCYYCVRAATAMCSHATCSRVMCERCVCHEHSNAWRTAAPQPVEPARQLATLVQVSQHIEAELPVWVRYRNHRGEVADRHVLMEYLYFGKDAWHPVPQWLVRVQDLEKQVERTFAVAGILEWLEG